MQIALEIVFYIVNLFVFYGIIIPRVGSRVHDKCLSSSYCGSTVRQSWHGMRVDVADGQWREFRNTLPLLLISAMAITLCHYGLRRVHRSHILSIFQTQHFHLVSSIIVLFVQHGWHAFVVIAIICLFYILSKLTHGSKFSILAVWMFALSLIALKESYRLLRYPGFEVGGYDNVCSCLRDIYA